jgi:hypothetical protein
VDFERYPSAAHSGDKDEGDSRFEPCFSDAGRRGAGPQAPAAGPQAPAAGPQAPAAGPNVAPPPPIRAPLPKGAHIILQDGDAIVDIKCSDDEPMRVCADITLQILEKLVSLPKK